MFVVVAGFKCCQQMRSWSHSLHSLAALAARARIPQHQSRRVVSSQAVSTTSAPKDAANHAASEAKIKIPELQELARPLGLLDPPRTTPLTEKEKLTKYLDPQKRLEERNHLYVVDQSHESVPYTDHSQLSITQTS